MSGGASTNQIMRWTSSTARTADLVQRLRLAGCVFAEDEARLLMAAARTAAQVEHMVEGRVAGLPLEAILGWAEFCGIRVVIEPGVFVPRRRTELLVRQAVLVAPPQPVVVDLCCGSGAVGAALASQLTASALYATDLDPVAVQCAQLNLAPHPVFTGDLFEALPKALLGRVDILVANAPYVPTDAIALMPPEARDHEPRWALDGGSDGLDVHRRIAAEASRWLRRGGQLLIEVASGQEPTATDMFAAAGLGARSVGCPELGATVLIATRP